MKKREINFYVLQMIWIIAFVVFCVLGYDSWWVAFAPSILVVLVVIISFIYVFIKSFKK